MKPITSFFLTEIAFFIKCLFYLSHSRDSFFLPLLLYEPSGFLRRNSHLVLYIYAQNCFTILSSILFHTLQTFLLLSMNEKCIN